MKKLTIITFVAVTSICQLLFAQSSKDTLKIKIGYFFCPQGTIKMKNMNSGTSVVTPVFGVVQFIKGKGLVNIMYNMAGNNLQVVYFHEITPLVGTYLVSNKNMLDNDGYSGLGFTRNVMNGNAVAFLEGGSGWKTWDPAIFAGVIFPLTFRIK